MSRTAIIAVIVAVMGLAVPWVITNDYYVNLASQILIYALLALSVNLLLGYGGMVSLGHAAFLGLTGYCVVLMVRAGYDQLTTAIASVIFSTACGALFGVLSLRAVGIGFLMITLALGQIVWGIAYRANELTGGDNGITLPARPMPFGIDINSAPSFYYFTLIVSSLALFCIWRLMRSPFGASLMGTREQPRRMSMLGHNVWMIQFITFVIAAAIGGGAADGDSRRRDHAARPDHRRRHHHCREKRGEHLHRALEHPARRDLCRRHYVHAERARARLPPVVALNPEPAQRPPSAKAASEPTV